MVFAATGRTPVYAAGCQMDITAALLSAPAWQTDNGYRLSRLLWGSPPIFRDGSCFAELYWLCNFSAEDTVATVVVLSVTRELTVLAGLMVAGRGWRVNGR